LVFLIGITLHAQFQMPDPKTMSGIPRPDEAQAPRSVSVRVIRGELSNNLPNQPVDLLVDGKPQTVPTGEDGRAQFSNLTPGTRLKAVTVVDGERLESQEFPAPGPGEPGIRLLLVATDKEREARKAAEATAPAVAGQLMIGGQSRIVVEPDDDSVRVFYLLDIVNPSSQRIEPTTNFMFDTPTEAQGTTVMEGSSKQATATATRVRVQGPFDPGETFIQVGYILPAGSGTVELEQIFPAPIERLVIMVKKAGDAKLASPQVSRQQEMPVGGDTYIVGVGDRGAPAGEPFVLSITGLPHHSRAPRWIALGLATLISLVGGFAAWRPAAGAEPDDRKQLIARREKLFQDLVKLENDYRRGRGDRSRYPERRENLLAELEQVYGALDDDVGPDPSSRTGLAA
jgi:hypothetical protein